MTTVWPVAVEDIYEDDYALDVDNEYEEYPDWWDEDYEEAAAEMDSWNDRELDW